MYRDGSPEGAGAGRREDALHHPGVAMGERLQRKLQRVASRRTAQWRDLLQPRRGQGADRSLAAALQHDPPPQIEEHTSELQSLMRSSYAVFCLKKKTQKQQQSDTDNYYIHN